MVGEQIKFHAFREFVTDKASYGIDEHGARIGETPNIAIDAGTPELATMIAGMLNALQAIADAHDPNSTMGEGWKKAHEKFASFARAEIKKATQS